MTNYRAIFFDAGGTLLHPFPSVGDIYSETASRYGLIVEAKRIEVLFRQAWLRRDGLVSLASHSNEKIEKQWWRDLVLEVFNEVGGVEKFEDFFDELYDIFAGSEVWRLYPDVPAVLEELKRRGKKLAVVSNWDSRLFGLCDALGITSYFDTILASAVVGASKPSPKIFERALEQLNVRAGEAVHIGDSLEDDVRGAQAAGIPGVLINRNRHERELGGVTVVHDLGEILELEGFTA